MKAAKGFVLEKKLAAVVRYYETIYVIHDERGERIFTGSSEARARHIQMILNRDARKRQAAKRLVKKKRGKKS